MSLTAVLNATLLDDDVARHTIDYEQKQEQSAKMRHGDSLRGATHPATGGAISAAF